MELNHTLRARWQPGPTGELETAVPTGWGQGRSIFGGLTGALLVSLGLRDQPSQRHLRTISMQLMRPVTSGVIQGRCRTLREGKNVAFVDAEIWQEGELAAKAVLTLVVEREGLLTIPGRPYKGPGPEGLTDLPYVAGMMPEFLQNTRLRILRGGAPFSGAPSAELTGFSRFSVPAGDAEGLVALLDVWPCPSMTMLDKPSFASTAQWTAHLLDIRPDLDDYHPFTYVTEAGLHGFHTSAGHLYAPSGELIGWTEQMVALFG